jgi:predicted RNA methylase
MFYYPFEGKRMYFPATMTKTKITSYIRSILIEQDINSPHRYLTDAFNVKDGDTVFDIGAAEGNFSLSIAEKASAIYIFEPDCEWLDALNATFEPWKDKVHIISKYVSDVDAENTITLDAFCKTGLKVDFIKADVEGYELKLLKGAVSIISRPDVKIGICTYHKQQDETILKSFLESHHFICEYSAGYMINILDKKLQPPYLRRGLIRSTRSSC